MSTTYLTSTEEEREEQTPPRVVEMPDAHRPTRRPMLLDDDDLDVPDFLK